MRHPIAVNTGHLPSGIRNRRIVRLLSIARPTRQTGGILAGTVLELLLMAALIGISLITIDYLTNPGEIHSAKSGPGIPAFRIAATSDGRHLWVQRGMKELEILDTQTGRSTNFLSKRISSLTDTRISHDGGTFILVIEDHDLLIYRDRQLLIVDEKLDHQASLHALSANGRVAVRVIDGTMIRGWEIDNDNPDPFESVLSEHAERVALDPTGQQLLVYSRNGRLTLHETKSGRLLMTLPPVATAMPLSADPIFTPEGSGLAVAFGPCIAFYNLIDGTVAWTSNVNCNSNGFHYLAISEDGRFIAAGGLVAGICVLNRTTGFIENHFTDQDPSNRVALSPSGDVLYCGRSDGSIKVFSRSEMRELQAFGTTSR